MVVDHYQPVMESRDLVSDSRLVSRSIFARLGYRSRDLEYGKGKV